jgi:steroid delta-isomerase-like uncharacterized protein
MRSRINTGFFLPVLLLVCAPVLAQVKPDQSLTQPKKEVKMNNENIAFKEYILLVHLPANYGPKQAKAVRELWAALLDKWKANGTYVTSFVYPNDGYLVKGPEKAVSHEGIVSDNFKLVSNMILRAADYNAAQELAKLCPVLPQGGMIEVKEIQPRATTTEYVGNSALAKNKATIRNLYEGILNTGKLDLLKEIIAEDYTGARGEKGPGGVAETVGSIRIAFPDIKWTVEDLMADGDKVIVRWSWKGTNKASFRGLPPSGKEVSDSAIAIYQFGEEKIVKAWIQSDKLGFLQQIGLVSPGVTTPKNTKQ